MVGTLVIVLAMAIIQVALMLYVRSIVADSAAEGTRYASSMGTGIEGAEERTRYLISMAISPSYASDITAQRTTLDGVPVVEVTVEARLPVIALVNIGPTIEVTAHAIDENALP